jgi:hypothetical protein
VNSKTAVQQKNEEYNQLDYQGSCKEFPDEEENDEGQDDDSEGSLEEEELNSEPEDEKAKCVWHIVKFEMITRAAFRMILAVLRISA